MGLVPHSWSYRGGRGDHVGFLPDAEGRSERSFHYFRRVNWRAGVQTGEVEERKDLLRSSLLTLLEPQNFGDERFHHLLYIMGGRGFVEGLTEEPVRISRMRKTVVLAPAGKPFRAYPDPTLPKPYLSFWHVAVAPLNSHEYPVVEPIDRVNVKLREPAPEDGWGGFLNYFPDSPFDDLGFRVRTLLGRFPPEGTTVDTTHKLIYVEQGGGMLHYPMSSGPVTGNHIVALHSKTVVLLPAGTLYDITPDSATGKDLELAVLSFKTMDICAR